MTTLKTVLCTLLALAALLFAIGLLGPLLALVYALVIGAVVAFVILADQRPRARAERGPHNTGRTVMATLWTVITVALALASHGGSAADRVFGTIFVGVMVATAILLNLSLSSEGGRQ
jgi:hypothetical protein